MKKFLEPTSIAVIGASSHEEKVGGILMKKLLGFKGTLIPVNPNHDFIFGKKCYKSVLDYDGQIDLAVIAIPADFVASSLEECGKKKIVNVIIISAGFSEIGNKRGEEQLLEVAKKYGIRVLGPNCFGICNPYLGIDTTFSATDVESGNVAFVSQSGALWSYISDIASGKFGFSGFVSLGNMADLDFNDFLDYFCKDNKTKSLVLYIEKLKEGKKFIEKCKRCISGGKKIYAVKAGSSKKGSEAAFSHTASLASDYDIYKGAFKQAGVELCSSLIEAFEKATCKNLRECKIPTKNAFEKKAYVITNAGGAGALISDSLSAFGVEVLGKPIDILGTALAEDYKKALSDLDSGKKTSGGIVIILTPQKMTEVKKTAEVIVEFAKKSGIKTVVYFLGAEKVREGTEILRKNKIQVFNEI